MTAAGTRPAPENRGSGSDQLQKSASGPAADNSVRGTVKSMSQLIPVPFLISDFGSRVFALLQ